MLQTWLKSPCCSLSDSVGKLRANRLIVRGCVHIHRETAVIELVLHDIHRVIFDQFAAPGIYGAGEHLGDAAGGESDWIAAFAVVKRNQDGVPRQVREYSG